MDKESFFGIMNVVTMVNGKIIFLMGKVLIFGLMVKNTLDNGLIIKCMEKDF
jgi:hypothetical protein